MASSSIHNNTSETRRKKENGLYRLRLGVNQEPAGDFPFFSFDLYSADVAPVLHTHTELYDGDNRYIAESFGIQGPEEGTTYVSIECHIYGEALEVYIKVIARHTHRASLCFLLHPAKNCYWCWSPLSAAEDYFSMLQLLNRRVFRMEKRTAKAATMSRGQASN
jgi:hypothetical protein